MVPVYNAVIDNNKCGINKISFVKIPAVQSDFFAFENSKTQVMFSADEDKRIVTGVLMRCDYPIIREDKTRGKYYVKFDRDTCRYMAEKLLADGKQNDVNTNHIPNSDVDGVNMFELFIKDTEKGINPKGFEDISDGSLFASYKVNNPEIWRAVKDGTFKGYSIEGMFDLILEDGQDDDLKEIMEMLDELFKKNHK